MQITIAGWVFGILLVANSEALPNTFMLLISALLVAAINCAFRAHKFRFALRLAKPILLLSLLAIGALVGASWASYRAVAYLDQPLVDGDWQVELLQVPKSQYAGSSVRARLSCRYESSSIDANCLALDRAWLAPSFDVQLKLPKTSVSAIETPSLPGEVWRLALKFERKPLRGNPGFDRQKWALSENIIGVAKVDVESRSKIGHRSNLQYWRYWFQGRIAYHSSVEQSSFSGLALAPIVDALTLGDRSGLNDAHWRLFRETGTSHLMAISGLHVGALSVIVFWLVARVVGSIRPLNTFIYPMRVGAIAAMSVAVMYAMLSGLALPSQRALIMLSAAYMAMLWGRPKLILPVLFLALFIILLIQPFAVLTASLWLSFFAVALIYFLIANRLSANHDRLNPVIAGLKIQASIFVGMIPVTLYFFGGASLNSFVANLIAIPLITFVLLPLGMINVLLSTHSASLAPILGELNLWLMDMLMLWLQWVNQSLVDYYVKPISWSHMGALLLMALLVLSPLSIRYRFMGGALFLILLLLPGGGDSPRAVLFNQGSVLLLLSDAKEKLVIDEQPGYSAKEKSLLKATIAGGVTSNSWFSGQQSWQVERWAAKSFGSTKVAKQGYQDLCSLPEREWQGVSVNLIDIQGYCVVSLVWQGHRWLLLGDIPRYAQFRLIADLPQEQLSDINFLLLSGSNVTGAFLESFTGATAFIWSDEMPSSQWLQRFQVRDIEYYPLAGQGAQVLQFEKSGVSIAPAVVRRFYH